MYLCNIQFGEVGEPSGPTSLFLLEIRSFYFKLTFPDFVDTSENVKKSDFETRINAPILQGLSD